jgi:ATP-dependent Clp protease ATP-binding subunit ClpB
LFDGGYLSEISQEVLRHIATTGFDPVYGARPLKRIIQQILENPLAQSILAGRFAPGDTIQAGWDGARFGVKAG